MNWIKLILHLLLGAFFILSAYSKLEAMESFEVYVYRSTFLTYDMATILVRLIIGFEFLAALALIFKLAYHFVWKLTMLFVLIMTGFLVWQLVAGDSGNCFCLGELIDLSPMESLLKNTILLVVLLFVKETSPLRPFREQKVIVALAVAISLVIPFILSPPDVFVAGRFNAAEHNQIALDDAISSGEISSKFIKGRKLLSFYSMNCKYCKMSSERISALVDKNGVDKSQVNIIFGGMSGNPIEFFEETHSQFFQFSRVHNNLFLDITKGRMPLTLLIEDGKVISEMNYRTIDEKEITNFLNNKN